VVAADRMRRSTQPQRNHLARQFTCHSERVVNVA